MTCPRLARIGRPCNRQGSALLCSPRRLRLLEVTERGFELVAAPGIAEPDDFAVGSVREPACTGSPDQGQVSLIQSVISNSVIAPLVPSWSSLAMPHPKRRTWFQLKRMRSRVRPMISAICSSPNLARSPGARFIVRPSSLRSAKRRRHLPTVFARAPNRSTIALFSSPSVAARTIRARRASPWVVFRRRAKPSSSRRSTSDKVIATAALLTSHPSNTADENIPINFSIRVLGPGGPDPAYFSRKPHARL